jgi:hypothetical protein
MDWVTRSLYAVFVLDDFLRCRENLHAPNIIKPRRLSNPLSK